MIDALFLNPLTKAQLKTGRRKAVGRRKAGGHTIRSKRLKSWQAVVKKHGGDMKAAAKEWKSRSPAKSPRRRGAGARGVRISVKGLSGLAARRAASNSKGAKGGVPMAARRRRRRRRRRNQLPPTAAWVSKWRSGMVRAGRTPKRGPKFRKIPSEPRAGQKKWKGRYKRKLRGAMRKHARRRTAGAKRFAARVTRGIRRSAKVNPVTYPMWYSRFMRGTGYAPYKKRTPTGRRSRRRRGPRPMTRKWGRSVVRGVKRRGQRRYARGVSAAGLPAKWQKSLIGAMKEAFPRLRANPRKARRRRRRRMRRYPVIRASRARGLMLNLMPKKRRRSRRKTRRGARRRRRMLNPVADSLRAMITQPSLMTYLYVSGGVAVGGVFPSIVSRYIWKGVKSPMTEAALGIAGSALAGIGVAAATKNDQNGVLVAAGGLAGVVGNFLITQLNKVLGFSGLGQAAEDALKAAVETEMRRAGLTGGDMGQFLLPSEAQALPGMDMGQFLTEPELQTDIAQTEGLGEALDLEATGSAAFDGSVF